MIEFWKCEFCDRPIKKEKIQIKVHKFSNMVGYWIEVMCKDCSRHVSKGEVLEWVRAR